MHWNMQKQQVEIKSGWWKLLLRPCSFALAWNHLPLGEEEAKGEKSQEQRGKRRDRPRDKGRKGTDTPGAPEGTLETSRVRVGKGSCAAAAFGTTKRGCGKWEQYQKRKTGQWNTAGEKRKSLGARVGQKLTEEKLELGSWLEIASRSME